MQVLYEYLSGFMIKEEVDERIIFGYMDKEGFAHIVKIDSEDRFHLYTETNINTKETKMFILSRFGLEFTESPDSKIGDRIFMLMAAATRKDENK